MRKIAEVTYSYNSDFENRNINTTLFCSLWWLDLSKFWNYVLRTQDQKILEAKDILKEKINKKSKSIQRYIKKLENILKDETISIKREEKYKIDIIINALIEKKDLLLYCLNWIPYELQKAGINLTQIEENREIIDKKQKVLDKKLFWWDIKENTEEVILCYKHLVNNFNDKIFSAEEKDRYKYFLSKIEEYLPEWYQFVKGKKLVNYTEKYNKIKVSDTDYLLWFNLSIEAQWWLFHTVEKNKNAKSISDWPMWIQFPTTDKFKYINLDRFLILNSHEIEVHNITEHNNSQILWNIRWVWSTQKDEWLAILMENFLQYGNQLLKIDNETWKQIINLDILPIKVAFTYILMWELLTNKELEEFLKLNEKNEKDTIELKSRFDRLKRSNLSDFMTQKKDTTYIRWLFKAANIINENILSEWKKWLTVKDLFLWKIWFNETKKFKYIKEQKQKEVKNLNILHPIFISDAIMYSTELRKKKQKIEMYWFLNYLKEKYPLFDFEKESIDILTIKTKKQVSWLINLTEKQIDNHNSKKISINLNNFFREIKINSAKKSLSPHRRKILEK